MPLYAYECSKCGAVEEHLQKFTDPPKTECAVCGGPLVRQISATAFHLRGGGWYKDLYASKKPGASSSSESSSSSSSSSSSESSSSSSSSGDSSKSSAKAASE